MNKTIKYSLAAFLAGYSMASVAIPALQVGAYAGVDDSGTYADYQASTTNPTETNTVITHSSTILFAGAYGTNVVSLGSDTHYSALDSTLSVFDGHNAIVLASVQDGMLTDALLNLTIGGNSAFHSSAALDGLFPNNHAPLKDHISDFLFFDIGSFADIGVVPNFDTEADYGTGEIKELTIAGMGIGGFNPDWMHFDLMAIEVSQTGKKNIKTTWALENNPGSKDVTWKSAVSVAEPSVLALMGIGLLGLGFARYRKLHT